MDLNLIKKQNELKKNINLFPHSILMSTLLPKFRVSYIIIHKTIDNIIIIFF